MHQAPEGCPAAEKDAKFPTAAPTGGSGALISRSSLTESDAGEAGERSMAALRGLVIMLWLLSWCGRGMAYLLPRERRYLAWGGDDGKTAYFTAATGIYKIPVKIPGQLPVYR